MANKLSYYNKLKRNPNSESFIVLVTLLKLRLETTKDTLTKAQDSTEIYRLQGRAMEMQEWISSLTRTPIVNQHDGAYGE